MAPADRSQDTTVSHVVWRDRNVTARRHANQVSASLIIPGGIATLPLRGSRAGGGSGWDGPPPRRGTVQRTAERRRTGDHLGVARSAALDRRTNPLRRCLATLRRPQPAFAPDPALLPEVVRSGVGRPGFVRHPPGVLRRRRRRLTENLWRYRPLCALHHLDLVGRSLPWHDPPWMRGIPELAGSARPGSPRRGDDPLPWCGRVIRSRRPR